MVEKKHVVHDLMLRYSGPLSIEGFYKEVEDWMREKDMHKELKKKSEDVISKGKRIEWIIEAWKNPQRTVKTLVRLRALFDDVKEVRMKRKGKNIKINEANAHIHIDGWIETSLTSRWTQKPLYTFLRTLYDKYIWNIGTVIESYEGVVNADSYNLHKRLKAFFELYKMKVS
jgi:hypothetical protein